MKEYRISRGTAELIGLLERVLSLDVEHEGMMERMGWSREERERTGDGFYQGVDVLAGKIGREIERNIRGNLLLSGGEEI